MHKLGQNKNPKEKTMLEYVKKIKYLDQRLEELWNNMINPTKFGELNEKEIELYGFINDRNLKINKIEYNFEIEDKNERKKQKI